MTVFKKTLLVLLAIFIFCTPCFALAQSYGLEEAENIQGVSKDEPRDFASRIITYALALIGIILLVLIIYGGFMYATSAGNEKQIETAKRILVYAVIGIIIVAMAWMISYYILQALMTQQAEPKEPPKEEVIVKEPEKEEEEEEEKKEDEIVKKDETRFDRDDSTEDLSKYINSCAQVNKKCLSAPSGDVDWGDTEDYIIKYDGFKLFCCPGLECVDSKCQDMCADDDELYMDYNILGKREINCCPGKNLTKNEETLKCEKKSPKLPQ